MEGLRGKIIERIILDYDQSGKNKIEIWTDTKKLIIEFIALEVKDIGNT